MLARRKGVIIACRLAKCTKCPWMTAHRELFLTKISGGEKISFSYKDFWFLEQRSVGNMLQDIQWKIMI